MDVTTTVWIIFGLGLAVTAMIWHLIRRAKKYENTITVSNRSSIVGSGNLVIQNGTIKQSRFEPKNTRTYNSDSARKANVSSASSSGTHTSATIDTSGTVIWPDSTTEHLSRTHVHDNDSHVSFGGGSFGGGGSGGSYDDDKSSYSSSSDSSSSWGSDSSSSDSGSSWSSSD